MNGIDKTPARNSTVSIPGDHLGSVDEYTGGAGTYVRFGHVYANRAGYKVVEKLNDKETIVSILRDKHGQVLPTIGAVVTAKITDDVTACKEQKHDTRQSLVSYFLFFTRCDIIYDLLQYTQKKVTGVNTRFCKLAILAVEGCPLNESFRGTLRKEDIRATEKDTVEIYKSFRPGDIVQARVTSLGDSQSYFLTTAENELGVVFAMSESGASMIPISWKEMQCPKTKAREFRKVAKVQQQATELH